MSQPSAFARRIVSSAVLAATLGLSGCFGLAVTGAAIGTVAVLDRRSIGAQTEDETIELRGARVLNESVNKDPMASVAITSFNRRALLTGQVPTEEMRAQAEEIVRTRVPNIKDIYNEVEIKPVEDVVTHEEGQRAAIVASQVSGVSKVVTLFEYVTDAELSRILGTDRPENQKGQGK